MAGLLQRDTNKEFAENMRGTTRKTQGKDRGTDNPAGATAQCNGEPAGGVLRTLEAEIIPQLIESCRGDTGADHSTECRLEGNTESFDIEEFTELLLHRDSSDCSEYLTGLRANGASLDGLYIKLLSPAARHIGQLWEEDRCSIIDVTLGVGRLQQLLREFSPSFQDTSGFPDPRRRVLLLPSPGEQHTFGLSLLAEFFRRAGWDLWGWPLLDDNELLPLIRQEWFGVVGISVSAEVNLPGVASLISKLRRVSSNRSLGVMVGGPIFGSKPELMNELGADATAVDARQAVMQAESLLSLQ